MFGNKLCELNGSKERERSSRLVSRDLQREGRKSRRDGGREHLEKHVRKISKEKTKKGKKRMEIMEMEIKGRRAGLGEGEDSVK